MSDKCSYYGVLDFWISNEGENLDVLEHVEKVLMYYLDKSEYGIILRVVVSLNSRDAGYKERLETSEKILQKLREMGFICRGIISGLVYEQLVEIHSSHEEAFSLLSTLGKETKFDEIAQISKIVPHITADILQQFKEALLKNQREWALEAVQALLPHPKEMTEELLIYVCYKILQIMVDVWQVKGVHQDGINDLLQLVKLDGDAFKAEVIKRILMILVHEENTNIDSDQISNFVRDNALDSNISIQSVAGYFGISERSVRRITKEKLGKTYKEYISELRLNKACELLKQGNLDIQSIAREVGYYNVTSFNRLFKHKYGLPPGEYRKQ